MKDNEIRGLVLQKYYDKRRQGFFQWSKEDFADLPPTVDIDSADLFRACDQLAEHGLIEWKPLRGRGQTVGGVGKITAFGVDVIEGESKPPISITLDHSISVHGSSNVQIGSHNVQDVSVEIGKLIAAINDSTATEAEKAEAKSLLRKFLEHPLVASVVGGLASTIK